MVDWVTIFTLNNILAGVQILSLIALIVYVIKTWEMASATREYAKTSEITLQEMKSSRDQEIAPYVVAYFDVPYGQKLISFVVKNVGKSVAKNVKLDISPMLANSRNENYSKLPFIKNGISSIPPGHEISTFIDATHIYFEKKELPLTHKVKITYFGGLKKEQRCTELVLDLSVYADLIHILDKDLNGLVKEMIEETKESHKKISDSIEGIKDNLNRGIWIKNPEISIQNLNYKLENWESLLLGKLNEYKILWASVYLNEEMKDINPFNAEMRNKFSNIGAQILFLSANHPPNIESELVDSLVDIGTKMSKLGRFHFAFDAKGDKDAFENFGNDILANINNFMKNQELILTDKKEAIYGGS